jgi:hypothetical protein
MAKSGLASDLGVFTWKVSDQSGSSRVSEISYRGLRLGRVRNRMDSCCLRCRPYSTDSKFVRGAARDLRRSGGITTVFFWPQGVRTVGCRSLLTEESEGFLVTR